MKKTDVVEKSLWNNEFERGDIVSLDVVLDGQGRAVFEAALEKHGFANSVGPVAKLVRPSCSRGIVLNEGEQWAARIHSFEVTDKIIRLKSRDWRIVYFTVMDLVRLEKEKVWYSPNFTTIFRQTDSGIHQISVEQQVVEEKTHRVVYEDQVWEIKELYVGEMLVMRILSKFFTSKDILEEQSPHEHHKSYVKAYTKTLPVLSSGEYSMLNQLLIPWEKFKASEK